MDKKTKIVATMGPASEDEKTIEQMIRSGVNVFRFNMKHGNFEWHHKTILKTQKIADRLKTPIGILIDLQGPEIRIQTKEEQPIELNAGDSVVFARKFTTKDAQVRIPHTSVFEALSKGDQFSIDDGFIRMKIVEMGDKWFKAEIMEDGTIKHMKTLNLYKKDINLPSLIQDDIERLGVADTQKVDYVALSFARSKKDLDYLRRHMRERDIEAQIVAKIESQIAIDNIDELIEDADVIMVARGDLGVEAPIEKLAYYQKMIINKCRQANTPVIVATQMLESMVNNPLPTRAEATDVANAVLDGADALMMSGETALGKYPVRAVKEMAKIAQFNELKSEMSKFDMNPHTSTELVVDAAVSIAQKTADEPIDHIVVMTETGHTARVVASYRPSQPIIAITDKQKTVETLAMSYGITALRVGLPTGKLVSPDYVVEKLKKMGKLKSGDHVLLIHGQHWKQPGQTNALVIVNVE